MIDYLWSKFQQVRAIFGGERVKKPPKRGHFMDAASPRKHFKIYNLGTTNALLMKLDHEKNHKFFDKSTYFWLAFKGYCFHGHGEILINAVTFCFLIKYKTLYVIMKIEQIEQTTIVYAQWNRWTSYDV